MKTRVIQEEPDEGRGAPVTVLRPAAPTPRPRTGRIAGGALAAASGVATLAGGAALVGVRTDVLLWLGVGALVAGALLAGAGAALIVTGRRGPRRREDPHASP